MCMFCAAVPAVMALGVAANAQQKETERAAHERGERPPQVRIPAIKVAVTVAGGLIVTAAIGHLSPQAPS